MTPHSYTFGECGVDIGSFNGNIGKYVGIYVSCVLFHSGLEDHNTRISWTNNYGANWEHHNKYVEQSEIRLVTIIIYICTIVIQKVVLQ